MSLAVVGPDDENPFFNNDFPFAPIGESSAIGVDDMLLIGTVCRKTSLSARHSI